MCSVQSAQPVYSLLSDRSTVSYGILLSVLEIYDSRAKL
jgi:hypothetical protein